MMNDETGFSHDGRDGQRKIGFLTQLLPAIAVTIVGCSSNNGDSGDGELRERSYINNGYYLSSVSVHEPDGQLTDEFSFELDQEDNTLTAAGYGKLHYNENGDLTKWLIEFDNGDSRVERVYNRSSNGRLSSVVEMVGEVESRITYGYDDNGLLTTGSATRTLGDDTTLFAQYIYEYDESDDLIRYEEYYPADDVRHTVTFSYDSEGYRTGYSYDDFSDGSVDGTDEAQYDDNGNMIAVLHHDEQGQLVEKTVLAYTQTNEKVFNFNNHERYYYHYNAGP